MSQVFAVSSDAPCGIPAGWTSLESRSFGLFQITPACGETNQYNLSNGHPNVTKDQTSSLWATSVYNPFFNIEIGAMLLAEGYEYFHNKFPTCTPAEVVLMAAAGHVQNWETVVGCNKYTDSRQDDYVYNVLRFYQQYYGTY